jgi:hypothetical protein
LLIKKKLPNRSLKKAIIKLHEFIGKEANKPSLFSASIGNLHSLRASSDMGNEGEVSQKMTLPP